MLRVSKKYHLLMKYLFERKSFFLTFNLMENCENFTDSKIFIFGSIKGKKYFYLIIIITHTIFGTMQDCKESYEMEISSITSMNMRTLEFLRYFSQQQIYKMKKRYLNTPTLYSMSVTISSLQNKMVLFVRLSKYVVKKILILWDQFVKILQSFSTLISTFLNQNLTISPI